MREDVTDSATKIDYAEVLLACYIVFRANLWVVTKCVFSDIITQSIGYIIIQYLDNITAQYLGNINTHCMI